MKKRAGLPLILAAMILFSGCGKQDAVQAQTTDTVPAIFNQAEYLLYQNVFYNDYGAAINGAKVTKRGVLGTVKDAFSDRLRYYVWGYLDNTRCCDWQWEFVPDDPDSLPSVGSLVNVTGTFASDEDDALDGWWIVNASVQTEMTYTGPASELDMSALNCTLERVQMMNILLIPDYFEGKAFSAYGRIAAAGVLEDPYYDGSWQIAYRSEAECPAIGTMVSLRGEVKGGVLSECTLEIMG